MKTVIEEFKQKVVAHNNRGLDQVNNMIKRAEKSGDAKMLAFYKEVREKYIKFYIEPQSR